MEFWHLFLVATIQGFTEFLPISSSAHLILVPKLFDFPDQGLAFDVSTHVGTLVAVVLYFRRDLVAMGRSLLPSRGAERPSAELRLARTLVVATVPICIVGFLCRDVVENHLRSMIVIGVASAAFGLVLWLADVRRRGSRDEWSVGLRDGLIIGLAQALAVIPGTSRSGITMTAALFLGLGRSGAARFSFFLSVPTITLAGGYEAWKLWSGAAGRVWFELFWGAVISGVTAYVSIHFFLKLVEKLGMGPFVIYRLLLGAALIYISVAAFE